MNGKPKLEIDLWIWRNLELDASLSFNTNLSIFSAHGSKSLLGDVELQSWERLKTEELKAAYLFRHSLLKQILALYLPISMGSIEYEYNAFGKPSIKPVLLQELPFFMAFNLSSSKLTMLDGAMAIAVAKKVCNPDIDVTIEEQGEIQVGVDIEHIDWGMNCETTSSVFMHANELTEWSLNSVEKRAGFFRLWTAKEAVLKCLGMGMNLDPSRDRSFKIASCTSERCREERQS